MDSLSQWIVQIISVAIVGLVGFFAKNAFSNVEKAMGNVSDKLNVLTGTVNSQHTMVALLEHRVKSLEEQIAWLKERV